MTSYFEKKFNWNEINQHAFWDKVFLILCNWLWLQVCFFCMKVLFSGIVWKNNLQLQFDTWIKQSFCFNLLNIYIYIYIKVKDKRDLTWQNMLCHRKSHDWIMEVIWSWLSILLPKKPQDSRVGQVCKSLLQRLFCNLALYVLDADLNNIFFVAHQIFFHSFLVWQYEFYHVL